MERYGESGLPAGRIVLATGIYSEDIALLPGVTLSGALDSDAIVKGAIEGAENAAVENLSIFDDGRGLPLLTIDNVAMAVRFVDFVGMPESRNATGIEARGARASGVVVTRCTFVDLATGVDIHGGAPLVRRSFFVDCARSAIHLRATALVDEVEGLSTATNAATGYNAFRFTEAIEDPIAVINETTFQVRLEFDDWGTDVEEEVFALIEGPSDPIPYLATGSAEVAASLYCIVWEEGTQTRITDATVRLEGDNIDASIADSTGAYAFLCLLPGEYTVHSEAPGFDSVTQTATVAAGALQSVIVSMRRSTPAEGEGEGEGEGERPSPSPMACMADTGLTTERADGTWVPLGMAIFVLLHVPSALKTRA